jgi:hypothetical protein
LIQGNYCRVYGTIESFSDPILVGRETMFILGVSAETRHLLDRAEVDRKVIEVETREVSLRRGGTCLVTSLVAP